MVRDIGSTMTVNVFLLVFFSFSLPFPFSFSIGVEVGVDEGDGEDNFSPPYRSGEAINGKTLLLAFSFSFSSPANASALVLALFPLPKILVNTDRSVLDFPFLCPFTCNGDAGGRTVCPSVVDFLPIEEVVLEVSLSTIVSGVKPKGTSVDCKEVGCCTSGRGAEEEEGRNFTGD